MSLVSPELRMWQSWWMWLSYTRCTHGWTRFSNQLNFGCKVSSSCVDHRQVAVSWLLTLSVGNRTQVNVAHHHNIAERSQIFTHSNQMSAHNLHIHTINKFHCELVNQKHLFKSTKWIFFIFLIKHHQQIVTKAIMYNRWTVQTLSQWHTSWWRWFSRSHAKWTFKGLPEPV